MSRDLNRLFYTDKLQTAKLLSPYIALVHGTESCPRLIKAWTSVLHIFYIHTFICSNKHLQRIVAMQVSVTERHRVTASLICVWCKFVKLVCYKFSSVSYSLIFEKMKIGEKCHSTYTSTCGQCHALSFPNAIKYY